MLRINEYFEGKVKSIGFEDAAGKASVGVMEAGDYEFGTAGPELMTVVSGELTVLLPGETAWRRFPAGTDFAVPAKSTFALRVAAASSYLCRYR
jgi:uncharacterized protein YaiE (UPF0345 family)